MLLSLYKIYKIFTFYHQTPLIAIDVYVTTIDIERVGCYDNYRFALNDMDLYTTLQTAITNADREMRRAFGRYGIEYTPDENEVSVQKGRITEFSLSYVLPPSAVVPLLQLMGELSWYGTIRQDRKGGSHVIAAFSFRFNP